MSRRTRRSTAESEMEVDAAPVIKTEKSSPRKKNKSTSDQESATERPPHYDPPEHEIVGPDFIQNVCEKYLPMDSVLC